MQENKTELKVFDERIVLEKEFRMYGSPEEPLFLAKDVAIWIEHSDVSTMIRKVDSDEKVKGFVATAGGMQEAWFVTLDGLRQILANSRKWIARKLSLKIEDFVQYKRPVKQVVFESMLRQALYVHLVESGLDWTYCPFNNKEDYTLTYQDALHFNTGWRIGRHRVDFFFPKMQLVVEYDEEHHKDQAIEDAKRESEILEYLQIQGMECARIIRVKEGSEFDGIIKILSDIMHFCFVF